MSLTLIVITPPFSHPEELRALERMFAAGLQTLHVRKPGMSLNALRAYLAKVPARYHKRIVIHSHYRLLNEFGLKGLHLTEKTRRKKLAAAFHRAKHTLSASFHSVSELKRIRRKYDYVFLSPVFDSISKTGYPSAFSAKELQILSRLHKKVIALGGTTPGTLPRLRELKFSGAAALGFVWKSKDPLKAYLLLRSKVK